MLSLLKTKLNIPKLRADFVNRHRLIERLNESLSHQLILVSAPAGFGKTSLLADWIGQCNLPVAWLSLDENDNDFSRFWSYFIAALGTIKKGIGESALASLQPGQPQPVEASLIPLINDITGRLAPFVIVLDDYHTITSSIIAKSIGFLLSHIPSQMHLVISGRSDPTLPLSRLRARNQMAEFRAADLRFTRQEIDDFVRGVLKLVLTDSEINLLTERTEGWVGSLQMAGISMQKTDDIPGFLSKFSGSHRFILEYLAEEVLKYQKEDIRTFLYQTSILGRMTGPLCDAVTGRNDSAEILGWMESSNLFIRRLDDEGNWFSYHQLFADVLSIQLTKLMGGNQDILYSRASVWFENEGLNEEAVSYALHAHEAERAADLLESIASDLIEHSQISILLKYVSNFSCETIKRRPWLSICYAWALLLSGQPAEVKQLLLAAEAGVQNAEQIPVKLKGELWAKIHGHALTIRAYVARASGDIKASAQLSGDASQLLPEKEITARSANSLNLAITKYMDGDVRSADEYFEEARTLAAKENMYVALEATCSLGDLEFEQGRLIAAADTYLHARDLGMEYGGGRLIPAAAHAFHGLASLYYEQNNLEEAARFSNEGIEISRAAHLPTAYKYANLALIYQAMGDEKGAGIAIKEALSAVTPRSLDALHISAWRARLLMARGDLQALSEWVASEGCQLNQSEPPPFVLEMPYLTLCRVFITLEEREKAKRFLTPLYEKAKKQGRIGSAIQILAIRALALQTVSKSEAVASLGSALSLADGKGYVRTFLDCGQRMQQLLRQTLQKGNSKSYIQRLLSAFPKPAKFTIMHPGTEFSEYLNEREKQILRLMADGFSNKTIAEKLYLSTNTVKWYARQTYGKLGASGRAEAVIRARALNII